MYQNLPQMLKLKAQQQPDLPAQHSKDPSGQFHPVTYQQLYKNVLHLAAALAAAGVKKGDAVGLISENRREWLVADLGILALGAADVPRGNDTTAGELAYILGTTGARVCFAETKAQAQKILSKADQLPDLKLLVLFDAADRESLTPAPGQRILSFPELLESVQAPDPKSLEATIDAIGPRDLATIIFTSGTTGTPKGVMLSHGGFINQVKHVPDLLTLKTDDIWLCVLPVWHVFERVMQYVALGNGCSLAYSKPIGKIMLGDMATLKPTWMASVPRIWESVMDGIYGQVRKGSPLKQALFHFFVAVGGSWAHLRDLVRGFLPEFQKRSRWLDTALYLLPWVLLTPFKLLGDVLVFKTIKQKLGGRFVAGISGGGALPAAVDQFFSAAGILLLEGYGITETSPVLGVRHQQYPWPGTVGPVFPEMEVQIRDTEGRILGPGEKGIIFARGPQVMLGYYKNPQLTAQVIDPDGWFNTGDLGMLGHNREIKILGRAKDTIVLRGGENVEPFPIESRIKESPYIQEAVVVGQDQKFLGALIVPSPLAWDAQGLNPAEESKEGLRSLLGEEIRRQVSAENGFKDFERITRFHILVKPFEVDRELSAKQEIKRHAVADLYREEITGLFG